MSLTLSGNGRAGRSVESDKEMSLLLDFHSPSAALTVTPVLFGARPVTLMVTTLVAACFAAGALIPIDKVVTAQGRVVALQATSVIQPLETAIVRSIDVREGDTVKKGQLLAKLDPTFATADVGSLQAQVDSLRAEVDRLRAEADGVDYHPANVSPMAIMQSAIFAQRKAEREFKDENYAQKISSLQTQVQHALADVYAYSERLKVASEVEEKRRELERLQVGSQLNRLAATDSRLEIKRGLDDSAAQAAQSQRDLRAMQAERDGYDQNWRSEAGKELTDEGLKLNQAEGDLKKAVLRRQLVELRADEDAVVLTVAKISPGSVMQSGEQLITLVPVNAPLEAEVNVAGGDAGNIQPGDKVDVKLETLPYTMHGTIDATVRVISPDSFSTQDSQQPTNRAQPTAAPPPGGTTYYRARLTFGEEHFRDTPPGFRLMPGMPLTADVKVGKRTLAGYLFARVLPAFGEGMREP